MRDHTDLRGLQAVPDQRVTVGHLDHPVHPAHQESCLCFHPTFCSSVTRLLPIGLNEKFVETTRRENPGHKRMRTST